MTRTRSRELLHHHAACYAVCSSLLSQPDCFVTTLLVCCLFVIAVSAGLLRCRAPRDDCLLVIADCLFVIAVSAGLLRCRAARDDYLLVIAVSAGFLRHHATCYDCLLVIADCLFIITDCLYVIADYLLFIFSTCSTVRPVTSAISAGFIPHLRRFPAILTVFSITFSSVAWVRRERSLLSDCSHSA